MPTYELINPSDPYTFVAENKVVASLVACLLGKGQYGAENVADRDDRAPIFLFGGSEKWFKENAGCDLSTAIKQNYAAIADALDSLMIGGFGERKEAESAIEKMTPEDAKKWLEERHDSWRSSMNDIGKLAQEYSARIRTKLKEKADADVQKSEVPG